MAPSSFLLIYLQICLLFLATRTRSEESISLTSCSNTNYTGGSPYESNLRSLITKLTASILNPSFYSIATIGSSPDAQVFGLAQCRPDVSAATCFDCINITTTSQGCYLRRSGAFRADHCLFRYSDQRFFSILEMPIFVYVTFLENASNPTVFNKTVNDLMNKISTEASEADLRFGEGMANYSDNRDVYGMAWCTQDISSSDCQQCLDGVVERLPVDKIGSQVMTVSCTSKFQTTSFFSISPPSPPPPQLPNAPSPTEDALRLGPIPVEIGNSANFSFYRGNNSNSAKPKLYIALPILALMCVFFILLSRKQRALKKLQTSHLVRKKSIKKTQSLLFDLDTIRKATNDFSEKNKLGEGGFGSVYKGLLDNGQEIAVKRLSRTSTQGFVEMKNEVVLVAKLQHKNLVRLLGCCLEHNENVLIYEYLPKTSLDKYLFDPIARTQLDWGTRYKIIEGIGRGLLYLHEESRVKIIHRDLKASNILLDNKMIPKISDFGLARIFGIDQTQQITNRIVGTYGYMAPEYAMQGFMSTKSDVFSYGVLILEIITGRRNGVFTDLGHDLDLLSYVWKYWNLGTSLQVVDQSLECKYQSEEVLRCLHIGLLCVQDNSLLRPSMASVMLMISSYSTSIPAPSLPPFYIGSSSYKDSRSSVQEIEQNVHENQQLEAVSANSLTITDLEAR